MGPTFSVAVIRSNSFCVESIPFKVSITRRRTRGSGRGPWWLKVMSSASLFSSASKSTGFSKNPFAPIFSQNSLYRSLASPETIRIGMCCVKLCDEGVWQTSEPEYLGIIKSSKIASGLCRSASVRASSAEPMSKISYESLNRDRSTLRTESLSSMIKSFRIAQAMVHVCGRGQGKYRSEPGVIRPRIFTSAGTSDAASPEGNISVPVCYTRPGTNQRLNDSSLFPIGTSSILRKQIKINERICLTIIRRCTKIEIPSISKFLPLPRTGNAHSCLWKRSCSLQVSSEKL